MQTLLQDLRYGARTLWKNPRFTLIAVITLALGIGANAVIFTIVNAVLLRPLPYPESERLVQMGRAFAGSDDVGAFNEPKFVFLRDNAQLFEAITGTQGGAELYLADESQAEFLSGLWVTADFFRVVGIPAARGRGFTATEDSPTGERVVVLSDELWRRRFGADAGMVGKQITLNNVAYTVVGIMPPGFEYYGTPDVILPMRVNPASRNEGYNWTVIGRLKPSVTPAQARAEMQGLLEKYSAFHPSQEKGKEEHRLMSWQSNMTVDVQKLLWILLGAVGFVLLIACANVANLQLARAVGRRREVAIRLALGVSRWRLLGQLLTEGVMLALVGGGAGSLLAIWGLDAMLALIPQGLLPRAREVSMDWRVFLFALGASLLTGIIAGLAPALQTLRVEVNHALKEGMGRTSAEASRGRLRGALVVAEIALALVLTVGAGLLLRTFANLRGVEPGFEARNTLSFQVSPRGKNYDSVAKLNELYRTALERLRSLPGVEAVAVTNKLPLDGWFNLPYRLSGEQNKFSGSAEYRLISPDYFNVMKMSLRRGRAFNENDVVSAEPVTIVNEAFAQRHFAGSEPLGQQIYICCDGSELMPRRIIGVVNETKQRSLSHIAPPTVFIPLGQISEALKGNAQSVSFVLRTTSEPLALGATLRSELRHLAPGVPVRNLRSLEQLLSRSVAPQRFNLSLLGGFAGLGLLLAAVGIYGVMAYSVSQRTHELGLRMALGAQSRDVLKLVVRQGMSLALLGVALGLIASLALTRLLKNLLFGVSATDPLTFALIALLLSVVALVACYIPARRATRVDPLVALRSE